MRSVIINAAWSAFGLLALAGAIATIAYFIASLPHEESPDWMRDMARIEAAK